MTKKLFAALSGLALTLLPVMVLFASFPAPAQAAVSNWYTGAVMDPTSTTDLGSATFEQSLQNLHATGANSVEYVVQYYQSNTGSTDIGPGYNTPTDASLAAAIDDAHALGMSVTLAMHVDTYDGSWRAYINPSDRNTWFGTYAYYLDHIASIAQAHHAEMIDIGTELVSMTNPNINSTNTQNWINLIQGVRKLYSGKLTYGANSTDNNYNYFEDEEAYVQFWGYLDYAGLSAYYGLNSDDSVAGLEGAWDYWNKNDIQGFSQAIGKPVLFTEIGYRSITNAHQAPWNWQEGGGYDATEQQNDYDALMGYWNNYSYMQGVYLWNWSTDPNAGGNGNTDYTPQGKPAQQIMTKWFTNPTPPGSGGTSGSTGGSGGTFAVSASAPAATVGRPATLTTSVKDSASGSALVDVEVYNQSGTRVFQQFYDNQSFSAGQTLTFSPQWTPSTAGIYTVQVGVFSPGWSQLYYWDAAAATLTVSAASSSGSGGSSGSGSTTTGTFTTGGSISSVSAGQTATVSASVEDSAAGTALVDLEVYDQSGSKVFQQFYDNEQFNAGQTKNYSAQWTPNAAGNYTLDIGIFAPGWSQLYAWNGNAANLIVGSGSGSTSGGGSTTGGSTGGSGSSGSTSGDSGSTTSSGASIDQNGQSVSASGSIDFTGRNFIHEENVVVSLGGSTVATVHADGGGNFSTGSISAPKIAGNYTYIFTGSGGDSATAAITVH